MRVKRGLRLIVDSRACREVKDGALCIGAHGFQYIRILRFDSVAGCDFVSARKASSQTVDLRRIWSRFFHLFFGDAGWRLGRSLLSWNFYLGEHL